MSDKLRNIHNRHVFHQSFNQPLSPFGQLSAVQAILAFHFSQFILKNKDIRYVALLNLHSRLNLLRQLFFGRGGGFGILEGAFTEQDVE